MLKINKQKTLLVLGAASLVLPVAFFIINNVTPRYATYADNVAPLSGFSDINFSNCVRKTLEEDLHETIQNNTPTVEQLAKITRLVCVPSIEDDDSERIHTLNGIEALANLSFLSLSRNNIPTVDVSNNTKLSIISISNSQVQSIILGNNTALIELTANNNDISTIDISKNTNLKTLSLISNQLHEIDTSSNAKLELLQLYNNQLEDLDVRNNVSLQTLWANSNNFDHIDVSGNIELKHLYVDNILVSVGLENYTDIDSSPIRLDISPFKFISENQDMTIKSNSNYQYDDSTNILTISNLEATNGYVEVEPTTEQTIGRQYKIAVPAPRPDDDTDGTVIPDTSTKTDETTNNGVKIPDTSTQTDETTNNGVKTPDTGFMTRENKDGISFISYLLPVLIITITSILIYVCGRKIFTRKRINF